MYSNNTVVVTRPFVCHRVLPHHVFFFYSDFFRMSHLYSERFLFYRFACSSKKQTRKPFYTIVNAVHRVTTARGHYCMYILCIYIYMYTRCIYFIEFFQRLYRYNIVVHARRKLAVYITLFHLKKKVLPINIDSVVFARKEHGAIKLKDSYVTVFLD